jgi:two-component system sensor histidine kinase/response regulator
MTMQADGNLLDPATLLAGCGGDPLLLQRMIASFRSRAPAHVAELNGAARRGDAASLRRAAHRLRGIVSVFSSSVAATVGLVEQATADPHSEPVMEQCTTIAEMVDALLSKLLKASIDELERLAASSTDDRAIERE